MEHPCMEKGLFHRDVRFRQIGILPHDCHRQRFMGFFDLPDDLFPIRQIRRQHPKAKVIPQQPGEPRFLKDQRDFINGLNRGKRDDRVLFHIAKQRNLRLDVVRNREVTSTDDAVRLNPNAPKLFHAVLRWFGLQLPGGRDVRQQCHMDVVDVFPTYIVGHLPDGFQKWKSLNVSNSPAYLHNNHVRVSLLRQPLDGILDHVGHVGNGLDGPPQVRPLSLFCDDSAVYLPCGDV